MQTEVQFGDIGRLQPPGRITWIDRIMGSHLVQRQPDGEGHATFHGIRRVETQNVSGCVLHHLHDLLQLHAGANRTLHVLPNLSVCLGAFAEATNSMLPSIVLLRPEQRRLLRRPAKTLLPKSRPRRGRRQCGCARVLHFLSGRGILRRKRRRDRLRRRQSLPARRVLCFGGHNDASQGGIAPSLRQHRWTRMRRLALGRSTRFRLCRRR
mmetsp:Transcript_60399/g.118864  ORF Transcript_60399/g.118864 Transcript_60399/m.118864 type:complete len:210 (+) Transcript_60399:833-1462(+)